MAVEKCADDNFEDSLKGNSKVIVRFFTDWCRSCKTLDKQYQQLSDQEKYKEVKFLDIDAEKNDFACKLAKVNNLPYFAVFKSAELLKAEPTSKVEVVVDMLNRLN